MKNIRKITLFCVVVLSAAACDKNFEEINTNPNVPIEITPDLLLSGIIKNTLNDQVNEAWSIGNIVVQHTAKIQFVNEDRYKWGERNTIWNSVYGNMRNVQNIINFAERAQPVQNNYLGIALIMKSWMFSLATDAYGDIPYTDAAKGKTSATYLTRYDTQESIYDAILADLRRANELLGSSSEAVAGDLLYGGGAGALIKWRKLANSLRLRYLMRISDRKDVKAEMQTILNDPAQFPVFESNDDNAQLAYQPTSPNQWPLYGSRVGSFDEFRLSKTLGDVLTAWSDPRLAAFARPTEKSVVDGAPPTISGIPNGLEDSQALSYHPVTGKVGGPQYVSRVGLIFACLVCNDEGKPAPVPNVARGLLMTYAELQFVLAEAREKNFITTGTAETYYTNGINANVAFYKTIIPSSYAIDLTLPAGYFTQTGVAYTGTQQEKLVKIGTQKWIALFFNGLEAWYDWRRTGIPALTPSASNLNNNRLPVRFTYPLSEQSLNGANREDALGRQGADDLNTRVWWDKN
jgi:hypothetical protein